MLHEFISAIFNDLPEGETVCYSRKGNRGWTQQNRPFDDSGPDYFCVCSVRAPDRSRQRKVYRKREDLRTAHCVVCDDVGTKGKQPPVEPSWIMETSKGNYQWGYIIEALQDLDLFRACMKGIGEAGYADRGTLDPGRVMRTPGSINDKKGKEGFQSQLVEWHPERRWRIEELMTAFGVEPIFEDCGRQPLTRLALPEDAVVTDPILEWLAEAKMVLSGPSAEGWYHIECPWRHEHQGDPRTDAKYRPLGVGDIPQSRAFHCFHSHGGRKHLTHDLLAWVQDQGGPPGQVYDPEGLTEGLSVQLPKSEARVLVHGEVVRERPEIALNGYDLPDVRLTAKGTLARAQLATTPNVRWILEKMGIAVRLNLLTDELELGAHTMNDVVDQALRLGITNQPRVEALIEEVAVPYHPMADWLREAPWDGQDRFEALVRTVTLLEPRTQEIWRIYLRRWLIQCAQAACGWERPRQMPAVLTFTGPQGVGKTRWFQSLVPERFFSEGVALHLDGHGVKDTMMTALQHPIAELGELDGTFRKSDVAALKNFLSRATDKYRAPYAKKAVAHPRKTSFCATVNIREILSDTTGNRRWWPVAVLSAVVEHEIDLQQLWAQVYQWWFSGEQWWLTDEEMAIAARHIKTHEFVSTITDACDQYIRPRMRRPESEMTTCTVTELAALPQFNIPKHDRRSISELTEWMLNNVGPKRTINGKRRCWLVPSNLNDALSAEEIARMSWGEG